MVFFFLESGFFGMGRSVGRSFVALLKARREIYYELHNAMYRNVTGSLQKLSMLLRTRTMHTSGMQCISQEGL